MAAMTTTSKPRRHRGEGTIWQRQSDGLWIGAIDVGWKDGKRQRKRVSAKTQRECIRRLNDARRAIEAGDVTTSSMRVDAWLRYWLDEVVPGEVKPKTLADYRSKVETYLIPVLGRHRLDRLTPIHVRELHQALLDRGLSTTTVTHAHWVLAGALSDAMTNVGLARNVTESVKPPGAAQGEGRAFTPEEVRRILDAAGQDRARWQFALYTGARQGECLGLRWANVDLDSGLADLAWSLQRVPYLHGCGRKADTWTCGKKRGDRCPKRRLGIPAGMPHETLDGNLCLVRPKTAGSVRVVPLAPGLVHALRELSERDTAPNPHGLVWHRADGRPVDGRADYRAWQTLLEKAKVPPAPLHAARHTAATIMSNLGIAEPVRMQMLGHSQVSTQRRYAHVDQTLTRAAMLAIEAAVEETES